MAMLNDAASIKRYEEEVDSPITDSLTGLFNHGFFSISLGMEIGRSMRYGEPVTLALFDIDAFASFNRRHDHCKGDRVLKGVAEIVKNNIRQVDIAARFSGDVFAVIYTKSDIAPAAEAAERIREAVKRTFDSEPTVSVGLASHPANAKSQEGLLSKAEEALLHAKMMGKNNLYYFEEDTPQSHSKPTILIVDDDPTNVKLMEAYLFHSSYEIVKAYDGEEALSIVNNMGVDLVLLDIMMPGIDGYEVCRRLKQSEATNLIPVVMVTALNDTKAKVKALEYGADDFVTKPPKRVELQARVKSLLRIKYLNNSLTTVEKVLMSLANAAEAKDDSSQGHVQRVASMAVALGRTMGLPETDIQALRLGGILHDIGKIGVSGDILNKPSTLNDQEWEVVKGHTDVGYRSCLPLAKNLGPALDIIRHHHERLDGSGYPDGLSGEELTIPSQIMTVADMYDAMTTDKPYRKAMTKEKALEILYQEVEDGKLDKEIVQKLMETIGGDSILSE